jgi:hypothetical protein
MANRKHGGLAEILRTCQAPGIRISGSVLPGIRRMFIPGVAAPPGGWKSADQIDRACAAARAPGAADSEMTKNFNRGIRSPVVDADKRRA